MCEFEKKGKNGKIQGFENLPTSSWRKADGEYVWGVTTFVVVVPPLTAVDLCYLKQRRKEIFCLMEYILYTACPHRM